MLCYIDDIFITGKNQEEHISSLEEVLCRLQQSGLKVKKSKCQFFVDAVKLLGHHID